MSGLMIWIVVANELGCLFEWLLVVDVLVILWMCLPTMGLGTIVWARIRVSFGLLVACCRQVVCCVLGLLLGALIWWFGVAYLRVLRGLVLYCVLRGFLLIVLLLHFFMICTFYLTFMF